MESYSADFRRALKEVRNLIKGMIKKNDDRIKVLDAQIVDKSTKYINSPEGQNGQITGFIINGNRRTMIRRNELPDELNKEVASLLEEIKSLRIINELLEDLIKGVQNVINVYNDDKVTKAVDTYLLLLLFEAIKINKLASAEVLASAFGMNVCASLKEFAKGDVETKHIDEICFFGDYYNPDGSFKYNTDEVGFLERLTFLCQKVNDELEMPSFVPVVDPAIAMEITEVLMQSNIKYFEQAMDAFMELLKACKLDEKEQKFILSLIEKLLNEQNDDINLRVLQGSELETYCTAKGILEALYYTDPDYYIVVEAFQNLTSTSELLLDAPDDEYLLSQKDELIAYLKEFNAKHLKVSEQSTNNLVLLGDYFASDLEGLQGDKKPRVLDILSRINKDNQGRFRKIMTSENISYAPYELIAKNVHVSFVEVDTGIYVLLGCSIDDSIFKTTINRIIKEEENLQIIEEGIKDLKRRNDILTSSEDALAELSGQTRK